MQGSQPTTHPSPGIHLVLGLLLVSSRHTSPGKMLWEDAHLAARGVLREGRLAAWNSLAPRRSPSGCPLRCVPCSKSRERPC